MRHSLDREVIPAAAGKPVIPDPLDWVAVHSLFWLLAANLVGLLLATLLIFPRLGDLLGPLTYGRWVPLHLDLHLYGWCSLPVVGLLLKQYLPAASFGSRGAATGRADWRLGWLARISVTIWSASLLFGALTWLDGHSSGKLFLEWSGVSRAFLALNLGLLAIVLLLGLVRQSTLGEIGALPATAAKVILLLGLALVPCLLYWSAGRQVYPPFNPDSGGATGGSLLGSTLGLIGIICATPLILRLDRIPDRAAQRVVAWTFGILALHLIWFSILDHGNRSHHEWLQIVSLASLVVWIPLLKRFLRQFIWPESSKPWMRAFGVWGLLLVATGVIAFLPGVLEHWKFTNALVGHAHIAMAGLVTSFNVLVMLSLADDRRRSGLSASWSCALGAPGAFRQWHLGLALQVGALLVLGSAEGFDPGLVVGWHPLAAALYAARWLGGAAMVLASARWFGGALVASGSAVATRLPGQRLASARGSLEGSA